MNVSDIEVGPAVVVAVRAVDGSPFRVTIPAKAEVWLRASDLSEQAWLEWGRSIWEVVGADGSHQRRLMNW